MARTEATASRTFFNPTVDSPKRIDRKDERQEIDEQARRQPAAVAASPLKEDSTALRARLHYLEQQVKRAEAELDRGWKQLAERYPGIEKLEEESFRPEQSAELTKKLSELRIPTDKQVELKPQVGHLNQLANQLRSHAQQLQALKAAAVNGPDRTHFSQNQRDLYQHASREERWLHQMWEQYDLHAERLNEQIGKLDQQHRKGVDLVKVRNALKRCDPTVKGNEHLKTCSWDPDSEAYQEIPEQVRQDLDVIRETLQKHSLDCGTDADKNPVQGWQSEEEFKRITAFVDEQKELATHFNKVEHAKADHLNAQLHILLRALVKQNKRLDDSIRGIIHNTGKG